MLDMKKVFRLLPVALLSAVFVLTPVYSQDEPIAGETPDSGDAAVDNDDEAVEEESVDVPDVLESDDESYRDIDDRDFTPSEEIPADQSITFPTDI